MAENDEWTESDFGLSVFYTILGGLIVGGTVMGMVRGSCLSLWIHGWILGPMFLLIGAAGLVRFIRSTGRTRPPE